MVEINEKNVRIFSDDNPDYILIHPSGKHELDNLPLVFDKIRAETDKFQKVDESSHLFFRYKRIFK